MGDATRYIEATRSLLHGHMLLIRGPDGAKPMALWPPGYPVLGGLLALTGLPAQEALLLLTRVSLAACVPAAVWALTPAIGARFALLAGILCVTGPGLLPNANLASTDAVFCCVSVLAAGCLIRGRFLLLGFLIALGLCIRNAGVALAVTAAVVIVLDERPSCTTLARLVRVGIGAAPPTIALMAWNLIALGSLRPYAMPPSTLGLLRNIADLSASVMYDFVPMFRLAHLVPWLIPVGAILLIALAASGVALTRAASGSATRRLMLFASFYVVIGFVMTVYARSRYEWAEPIWARHTSPYDWLLLPVVMAVALGARPNAVKALVVAGLVVLGLRGADMANRLRLLQAQSGAVERMVETGRVEPADSVVQLRQMYRAYERVEGLGPLVRGARCVVVTNLYDLIQVAYDVPAVGLVPLGGAPIVFVEAALPPGSLISGAVTPEADLPSGLVPVTVAGLPAGLRVRSNAPEVCLPKPARTASPRY